MDCLLFSTFVAIVEKECHEKFRELLAYQATILTEALRFGCKGWLCYNKLFREHVEKEPNTSWSMLHSMFYSLSFLSQRVEALMCPRCMALDHSKAECAYLLWLLIGANISTVSQVIGYVA